MFAKSKLLKLADKVLENVEKTKEDCWEWQGAKTKAGYGITRHDGEICYTHRIILQSHGEGFSEDKEFACHKCDNPSCVNPEHLYAGNHTDNMEDAKERSDMGGARVEGEDHGESKLTEKQVITIREQYATGHWTQKELANSFDIARTQIGSIVRGENWENAGGPITEIGQRNQWQMPNSAGENPDKQGENHHNSSLTEEDVIEIREKYHDQAVYQKDLADEYGVARSNIGQIVRGDSWESAGGPTG